MNALRGDDDRPSADLYFIDEITPGSSMKFGIVCLQ
jgi:hypothetical protein